MNIEDIKKNEERNSWFRSELIIFWITFSLMYIVIYPWLMEYGDYERGSIIFSLIKLTLLIPVAAVFAMTQTRYISIKKRSRSVNGNFQNVLVFILITIIIAFFVLTESYIGHKKTKLDTVVLGRKFLNLGTQYGGYNIFKTIIYGSGIYAAIWYIYLKRITDKDTESN